MSNLSAAPLSGDYRGVLQAFQAIGYESRQFTNFDRKQKHLIIRHDVDFSLELALKMAKTEHDLGCVGAYFILLTSPFYNSLEPNNLKYLKEIHALGHDIGLHLELEADVDLHEKAQYEAALLAHLIDDDVDLVSFHRPTANTSSVSVKDLNIEGLINVYQEPYFDTDHYCSDSRGAWHYHEPLKHPCVEKGEFLQFLTHPMWWGGSGAVEPKRELLSIRADLDALNEKFIAENFNV